jgi:hypothetical protein
LFRAIACDVPVSTKAIRASGMSLLITISLVHQVEALSSTMRFMWVALASRVLSKVSHFARILPLRAGAGAPFKKLRRDSWKFMADNSFFVGVNRWIANRGRY